MSQSLIADLGSELSNSYCDIAWADAYWAGDYRSNTNAQWTALSAQQKTQVLIAACRTIEQVRFTIPQALPAYAMHYDNRTRQVLSMNLTRQPVKFNYYQRLQFPRNLDVYYMAVPSDVTPPAGYGLGQLYIPDPIKEAQCEQAMYLLTFDDSDISAQLQGIASTSTVLGKQDVQIDTKYSGARGSDMSPRALSKLKPYMVKAGQLLRA